MKSSDDPRIRTNGIQWDGLTSSLRESVLSGAIGDGASRTSILLPNLARIEQWLMNVPPPAFPYDIDKTRAAEDRAIYDQQCAQCHAPGGARTGSVIPVEEIGTDRHRLDMWTAASADTYNRFADDYPWDFSAFRKTNGYVALPLDGVWLRAPYLGRSIRADPRDPRPVKIKLTHYPPAGEQQRGASVW